MSPKINRKKKRKKNICNGHWHSSPQFCIQAFLITRYNSRVIVQKGGVGVDGPSWLDWKQTHLCIFTRQNYFKVRLAAEVHQWHLKGEFKSSLVQSLKQRTIPIQFVFCLICSSNCLKREIISLNERTHAWKHWKSHSMSHLYSFLHFSVPQLFVQDSMY